MSQIPITQEYAAVVGRWCEKVESRSLLLNKFALPKNWGDDVKLDQASKWSLMRIASNGSILLNNTKEDLKHQADKQHNQEKSAKLLNDVRICSRLANTATGSGLESLRSQHSARFLELLRGSHNEKGMRIVEGRLEGRLAINLAEGVIQNAGINLDRIFGLPLIPGSAVKGVTRAVALEELKSKNDVRTFEIFARVFGYGKSEIKKTADDSKHAGDLLPFISLMRQADLPRDDKGNVCEELKGAVTFLQSTPTNEAKIVVDITNVHTPEYYRTGIVADLKKESPRPNYFPAVEKGAEFAFPILLNSMSNDVALLDAAERWLKIALAQHGIGAKTAAGYGWFCDITAEKKAKADAESEILRQQQEKKAALQSMQVSADAINRLSKLDEGNLRGLINRFIAAPGVWTTPEEDQRALLEVPLVLALWGKEKDNPKSKVTKGLTALAEKFGVKLP